MTHQKPNTFKACADCAHVLGDLVPPLFCAAPQLAALLDDAMGHQNQLTTCQAARDFKFACGHSAKWFVQKQIDSTHG